MTKKKENDDEKCVNDSIHEQHYDDKKDISKIKEYVESGKVRKAKKNSLKEDNNKAIFIKRFFAFVFDMFIVSLAASLLSSPFMNTEKVNDLSNKYANILNDYMNQEITDEEYNIQNANIVYKLAKEEGVYSLVTMVLTILYFVVLPVYYNGQTLGKKIAKIKIKSDVDELSINQSIFRCFIANFLLLSIVSFIFMLTLSKDNYITMSSIATFIQYFIVFVSVIMVMFRKDGRSIHDILCKTRVINVNE